MKNRNFCKLLAITVIVTMLSAGCGASNAEPAKEEAVPEAAETMVTGEMTVTEESPEVETVADTSETTKPEEKKTSSTERQDTIEVKYLIKTEKVYEVSEDGKKELTNEYEYNYDDNGNCIHWSLTFCSSDMPSIKYDINDEYDEEGHRVKSDMLDSNGKVVTSTKYEFDEEGRTLKEHRSSSENSSIVQYSYTGNQFTCDTYQNDVITESAKGFVLDGENYITEEKNYNEDNPKTEDDESYANKSINTYEGNRKVKSEYYNNKGELYREWSYEYELDENNNPITQNGVNKDIKSGDASTEITEYTYIQFK